MGQRGGTTVFDKIWDTHVVARLGRGYELLHVDRHYIHDLVGPAAFAELREKGHAVRTPRLNIACVDHAVSTALGRTAESSAASRTLIPLFRRETTSAGVALYDLGQSGQGIIHVMGPELGLSQPGLSVVCGDSHTCTHGGVGALAFGIGSSELVHVLATQTIRQLRPLRMRVRCEGRFGPGVFAKDLILHLIGRLGTAAGTGYAVEYAGSAVRTMSIEERMTVCNLSIELGAKIGLVAPDDTTFSYIAGREFAPRGAHWDAALASWRRLLSADDATFDREIELDAGSVAPQVSWGNSPEQTMAVDALVPDPADETDPQRRRSAVAALEYMGLQPGRPIVGTPVDWVFIGSCANGRLSDLREAAAVVAGCHVAPGVHAWVVPGSDGVRRHAEAEGLHRVFVDAGFEWREPGCSMCVAVNGETLQPGERSMSTSNRNFVGRQGAGARTHLASPATAAAAALAGAIVDPRRR